MEVCPYCADNVGCEKWRVGGGVEWVEGKKQKRNQKKAEYKTGKEVRNL